MKEVAHSRISTPAQAERREREAIALRTNLQRRKQQARDRIAATSTSELLDDAERPSK